MSPEEQDEFSAAFAEAANTEAATTSEEPSPAEAAPAEEAAAPKEAVKAEEEAPKAREPEKKEAEKPDPAAELAAARAELDKERQRYNSERGRREALEARLRAREEEEAKAKAPEQPKAPDDSDLDDIEKKELADFRKRNPELAKNTVDGPKAKAWRKILLDDGEDKLVAMADLTAPAESGKASEDVANLRKELEERDRAARRAALERVHPDWFQQLANPNATGQNDALNPAFVAWLDTLPHKYAVGAVHALQGGTVEQIGNVLTAYKEFQKIQASGGKPAEAPPSNDNKPKDQREQSATAVSGRAAPPPRGKPDKDDFLGAWNEASRKDQARA